MINTLKANGYPEPVFEENGGGFPVTFFKDTYTEDILALIGLDERKISAVIYLKIHHSLSAAGYQDINFIGKTIATRELHNIMELIIIDKIGIERSTKYRLKK